MNIEIRKPKFDEWEKFKALRLESLKEFPTAFASSYDEQIDRPDDEWKQFIMSSEEGKSSIMVCAYDGDQMVGSVAAYWSNREKVSHVCNLGGMFVRAKYQNQGVGRKLVEKLFKLVVEMDRFRKIQLNVVEDNLHALNFYKKMGFIEVGVSRDGLNVDGHYHNLVNMDKFL